MALSLGVLVIGSLYWDPQDYRKKWRDERLDIANAITVACPIRYGRKSRKRADTYTMVFSPKCNLGRAKLVPCRKAISSIDDLFEEAERLWSAERLTHSPPKDGDKLSANWGCVALGAHPRFEQSEDSKYIKLLFEDWARRVESEKHYGGDGYVADDGVAVSQKGILQIAWPTLATREAGSIDLIITTVTKPTVDPVTKEYPTVATIAAAWKRDTQNHLNYFCKNRDAGIVTFQDDEILKQLGRA